MSEKELRNNLRSQTLEKRRNFLKKALVSAVFVSPIVTSFSAGSLVRANSCVGYGHCGGDLWGMR